MPASTLSGRTGAAIASYVAANANVSG